MDAGPRFKPGAGRRAPGTPRQPQKRHVECDFARFAPDGQIADQAARILTRALDTLALKGQDRVMLGSFSELSRARV